MTPDVLIVGAGISGLSLGRALKAAGLQCRLLDRSKKPGGRCATKNFLGQPVDFGPVFLHGSDPEFIEIIRSLPGGTTEGWPVRVAGHGAPCHPGSLGPGEIRLAPSFGLNTLAKILATGLDVSLETRIQTIRRDGALLEVVAEGGEVFRAPTVVLTLPPPQARELVLQLGTREAQALAYLLTLPPIVSCLALAVAVPSETPDAGWDVLYPSDSKILTLVADETHKRPGSNHRAIVLQGTPRWSDQNLEAPPEIWSSILRAEGARFHPALQAPSLAELPHRWKFARLSGAPGLTAPVLQTIEGGARLGLAGEAFDPQAGVEGAFRSGRELARRIVKTLETQS